MRRQIEFRCLLPETMPDATGFLELERRLSARGVIHKRQKVSRSQTVRLLVHRRHYDIAFRVMLEFSSELAPGSFAGSPGR